MTYKQIFSVLSMGAALVLGGAYHGYAQDNSGETTKVSHQGRLCHVYKMEIAAEPDSNGLCIPPAYQDEGGQCVTGRKAHNAFSYIINDDRSLDFGLSYWFASGAHCGIIGNAQYDGEKWRYESNMDSDDPNERCAVNITINAREVIFDADPNASCRMECGAGARLTGTSLPLSSVVSNTVTAADLEPETFYNTPCP